MKTLEGYLLDAEHKGIIDHAVRMQRGPGGEVQLYIHPQGVDGETLDFRVQGNGMFEIPPVYEIGEIGPSEGPALATQEDLDALREDIRGVRSTARRPRKAGPERPARRRPLDSRQTEGAARR